MEMIERILSQVVGKKLTLEEQETVAGGLIDRCEQSGYVTVVEGAEWLWDH